MEDIVLLLVVLSKWWPFYVPIWISPWVGWWLQASSVGHPLWSVSSVIRNRYLPDGPDWSLCDSKVLRLDEHSGGMLVILVFCLDIYPEGTLDVGWWS